MPQKEKGPLGKICYVFKAKEQQYANSDANAVPMVEFSTREKEFL